MSQTVSIITVSYNAENTIGDCIRSVANQNFEVEHILVDGQSTDRTLEMANKSSVLSKQPIRIVSEPDDGIYDAMNKGIKLSTRDIVGFLNSDDYYANNQVLSDIASVFERQDVDCCYGDLAYVSANDTSKVVRRWRSGEYKQSKFYWGWMPPHPTFFVRRSVYQKYGLFDLDLGSAADYEIMLRLLFKHDLSTAYIPDTLVYMRTGGVSNSSFKNRFRANLMDRRAWRVNDLKPYPWTLSMKPLSKLTQYIV